MRLLLIICLIFVSSCHFRIVSPGYYVPNNTIITPTYPWWSYRRPTYLGNVYNTHHHYYTPPRTNLPMNPYSGPRGGRRK